MVTCFVQLSTALPGSHKLYASGDAAGAAAAAAAAPSTELTSGGEFGGPITRAEALTGFFAGMVSTAVVLTDMSRARAVDDGLGVMDDLLTGCPSVKTTAKLIILYGFCRVFNVVPGNVYVIQRN